MSIQFWGAMLALPLGQFLYWLLAEHEGFTRELVEVAIIVGLIAAIVAEVVYDFTLSGDADMWIISVSALVFLWTRASIASRKHAAIPPDPERKDDDADLEASHVGEAAVRDALLAVEIIPPERPQKRPYSRV
jgi:hypothetical protein